MKEIPKMLTLTVHAKSVEPSQMTGGLKTIDEFCFECTNSCLNNVRIICVCCGCKYVFEDTI